MSFNCRSIRNKVPDVLSFMKENDIDIAFLQETWINQGDASVLAEIRDYGYQVISQRRKSSDIGGGVGVIYKHGVDIKKSDTKCKHKTFECLVSSLKLNGGNAKIVNIYRTPYSKNHRVTPKMFLAEFTSLLDEFTQFNGKLILTGDFNLHLEDTKDFYAQKFKSTLEQYALTQLIDKPTHEEGGILDLLITAQNIKTTDQDSLTDVAIHEDTFGSDHHPIIFSLPKCMTGTTEQKRTI